MHAIFYLGLFMNKLALPLIAIIALISGFFISDALTPKELHVTSATWFKKPMVLPTFSLTDHNNKPFNKERFIGKWSILFFGYTNCPDVCPDSLNMLKTMVERLEPELRKKVQVVFITVDPERDTANKLKSYVTFFNKDFIGAFTPLDKLEPFTKKLGIMHYISKTLSSYNVSHAGNMLLINPNGDYNAVFSPPHDSAQMALDLEAINEYF